MKELQEKGLKAPLALSQSKPLSGVHSVIRLKVVSMEERQALRIPSYRYLLP